MSKIYHLFVIIIIVALASYAAYTNVQLKQTVSRYEEINGEMAKKFAKLSEEQIRTEEELTRQKAITEEVITREEKAAPPAAETVVKQAEAVTTEPAQAGLSQAAPTAKIITKASTPKDRAEAAKVQVEELLGKIKTTPQPWEEREAHL